MTVSPSATAIIARVRSNGKISPSLIPHDADVKNDDGFFLAVSNLIAAEGLSLRDSNDTPKHFQAALKMTQQDSVTTDTDAPTRQRLLAQRRSILLAITAGTPDYSLTLNKILNSGYLLTVKAWLDDILSNTVGSVDLLLHMLNCICSLPVTKEMVTSSKLGKQVAAVERHKICVGGMNESAIKERVGKVKEMWSASVKRMKKNLLQQGENNTNAELKRNFQQVENDSATQVKKAKTEQPRKSLLSGLIKKGSPQSSKGGNELSKSNSVDDYQENENGKSELVSSTEGGSNDVVGNAKAKQKKIKWADNNGGNLSVLREAETNINKNKITNDTKKSISHDDTPNSDEKKRDRLREKELLKKARKSKLLDKDDNLDTMAMMFSAWQQPKLLPVDSENPPVQADSKEGLVQAKRMSSVLPVTYLSEEYVPTDPFPLTAAEERVIASQSSQAQIIIPFFVPESEPEPEPAPVAAPIQVPVMVPAAPALPTNFPPPTVPPPAIPPSVATVDIVKAMGLPLFLAGQNLQALQTLAASPGLLNAFVDHTGAPDQARILNLVQTLTQNLSPHVMQAPPPAMPPHSLPQPTYGQQYGTVQTNHYQAPPQASPYGGNQGQSNGSRTNTSKGYRGDQNVSDGNLHLSGYGPMTTPESIIALFSPYVKVDEVVPKNGFMFVNTNDPDGARRAREALNGVILGGSPLRINVALRRNKNPQNSVDSNLSAPRPDRGDITPLPRTVLGQVDYDNVRDDRGNPATKNLFVAGYGQSTTENELRDIFNQHTTVTGVVLKGSFAFVNTSERNSAIHAREAITGTVLNGGVLRINFAKESGRLGTSFDHGYGTSKSPVGTTNYYGRNY